MLVSNKRSDERTPFIKRNIGILRQHHEREQRETDREEKIANAITRLSGSMAFLYGHAALVGLWMLWNIGGSPGFKPFDPTFFILTITASVEAIFLSTIVLISQNCVAVQTHHGDEHERHMILLAERETTQLLSLMLAVAKKRDVADVDDPELDELQKTVEPEVILDHIEVYQYNSGDSPE